VLVLVGEEAEVARQIDQGGLLVVQLEFDAPDRARLLAAVVEEILDRHFAERRRLVSSQGRKIEVGVALDMRIRSANGRSGWNPGWNADSRRARAGKVACHPNTPN